MLIVGMLRVSSFVEYLQIGLMGLVEKEWIVTLATVEIGDIVYEDFVATAKQLVKELREEVRGHQGILIPFVGSWRWHVCYIILITPCVGMCSRDKVVGLGLYVIRG